MSRNRGNAGWNLLGDMINTYFTLKAIPYIILILVVFYGAYALLFAKNNAEADETYISSSDYSNYVIDIASNHADSSVISVDTLKSRNTSGIEKVYIYYDFTTQKSYDEYEDIAREEILYVYNAIKDTKIKKEKLMYPSGEDLYFRFRKYEDGQLKEIGSATIFYIFGALDADDYINKTDTIIFDSLKN